MFDLFRSRDKAVRILLGALLVLVGFSMLTYLVPNYNTGGAGPNDQIIAQVGKDQITLLEVQRLIQNTMRGRQLPPEILPNYIPTMVNSMITERALAFEAGRLGYEVTDTQVRQAIQQYVPSLFQDGRFVGKEAYAQMLSQQNMSIGEFENDMRRQLLITRLRNVALEGTVVTPLEIEQEYRKKNEKVKVEFVKIASDKYKNDVQPTAEDLQSYHKANASKYTIPERKNLAILVADQAKLEQSVTVSDADLLRAYSQDQNLFRVPESVKVRHILLKTQGKPPAEEAQVKTQADDLLKQVKSGANFGELVKKFSEDTASVPNGGEYTVQKNGQMVAEFETAAFSLKPGESSVIKTTYGYHVIQVMAHDQARIKPFDEVKGELAAEFKKQKVSQQMQQISEKAQSMLQKDPARPEKVAADLNMQLLRAENVEPGKPVADLGANPDFDQSLTGLKKGEVTQPVALSGNKIVVALVTDVLPSRPANLNEVEGEVRNAIIQARLVTANQNHAAELIEKAKSGGDLAKAAKSMGLEAKTSAEFARNGTVDGLGSASYVSDAFNKPEGSLLGPLNTPDGTVIAKVVAHVQPDMAKLPEQRDAIRDELKQQKARDRNMLFETGVRDALIKEGKVKIHQDVLNRLIANYRTS